MQAPAVPDLVALGPSTPSPQGASGRGGPGVGPRPAVRRPLGPCEAGGRRFFSRQFSLRRPPGEEGPTKEKGQGQALEPCAHAGSVTREIDAVVFDFDGVLASSIELHAVAYQLVLKPFDVPVDPHQVFLWEGARSETIIRSFMEAAGRDPDDDLVKELSSLKQRIFERVGEPSLYAWSQELVETVDERGFPMAICSGTRRENVPGIAGELADRFDFLATEETYANDKPHPEPFETAAKGLGVPPERCLAVENAPRGIESAKDAGMLVVGVATTLDRDEIDAADIVLDDVLDLLDILPDQPGEPVRR